MMAAGMLLLLLLLVNLGLLLDAAAQLACEQSGICSLGKVKPFFGDVGTSAGLQAALQARSYKKEVVVAVHGCTDEPPLLPVNMIGQLKSLGFEHLLMLSAHKCCDVLSRVEPGSGCGFVHFKLPGSGLVGVQFLWAMRRPLHARIVRMGYNLLALDLDIGLYDDPYKYFKAPPFRDINLMSQVDWAGPLSKLDDHYRFNGGVMYVQGAAPDGPTAWALAELMGRMYRLSDAYWAIAGDAEKYGRKPGCLVRANDQWLLDDVVPSAWLGRPVFPLLMDCAQGPNARADPDLKQARQYVDRHIFSAYHQIFNRTVVPTPPEWRAVVGSDNFTLRVAPLRMPHFRGDYSSERGGRWTPPPPSGPHYRHYIDQFTADCPSCPFWPDPENESDAARAAAAPVERFAFLPAWMALGWFNRGRLGYWGPSAPPQQVIAHIFVTGPGGDSHSKSALMMYSGLYNWTAHGRATLDNKPFFTSTRETPVPRFLAFHPNLNVKRVRNWVEFMELLHSLAQLGRMSGRAVLLPDVPCSAPWVQQAPGGAASLPLRLDDTFVPHGRLGPSGLRCTSNLYLRWNCQKAGQAVISAEYDHWWSTLPADKQAELRPGRHNTVLRPDVKTKRHLRRLRRSSYNSSVMRLGAVNSSGSAGGAVSNMTFARSSLADEVLTVDAGAVAELLYQHDSQQVLYLAHPVVVWERPVPSGAVAGLEEGAGGPPPPPPSQRPPPCALLKSNSAGGEAACKRLAKGETLYHQMASECEIFSLSAYNWHNKEGPRSDYNHWKQGAAARIKRASLLPEGVLHYDTSAAQL